MTRKWKEEGSKETGRKDSTKTGQRQDKDKTKTGQETGGKDRVRTGHKHACAHNDKTNKRQLIRRKQRSEKRYRQATQTQRSKLKSNYKIIHIHILDN